MRLGPWPTSAVAPLVVPLVVPLALAWVRLHERRIRRLGRGLRADEQALARALRVARPAEVRLLQLPAWPRPMRWFCRGVSAMTLGHGIWSVGPMSPRLLAHELAHVRQVEAAGSLRAFLGDYLRQVARHGYWHAPLEVQAREAATAYSDVAGRPCSDR